MATKEFLSKKMPRLAKVCDRIFDAALYALLFLMPILFLPWTSDAVSINKQTILIVLVCVGLFARLVRIFANGSLEINAHKVNFAVGGLLLAYMVSTIFSVAKYDSVWGRLQLTSGGLVTFIALCVLYFLVSSSFSGKKISQSFVVLAISTALAQIYGLLQLMHWYVIPLNFTKNADFHVVGSAGGLGMFVAVLLPLFMVGCIIFSKRWHKVVCILNLALALLVLLLINYPVIWVVALIGSLLVVAFWLLRRDIFDGRWMFLPIFFVVVSFFCLMFGKELAQNKDLIGLPESPFEVSILQSANLEIDKAVLKKSPIWGSGPETFIYDFQKYKGSDFNKNSAWAINFTLGSSKILTDLATLGGLGMLAFFALMILPLVYAFRYLWLARSKDHGEGVVLVLVLTMTLVLIDISYFLSNSNIVLDTIYFFLIAGLVALISKERKTYVLKPSSLLTLAVTFIATISFIFGLGILVVQARHYVADVEYAKSLWAFSAGNKDGAIQGLQKAISLNDSFDGYFSQQASFILSKLQDVVAMAGTTTNNDTAKQVESLVSLAVARANQAIALNPNNGDNWATRAYICQNIIAISKDAADCALSSYDKAAEKNPYNPSIFLQKGNTYLVVASRLPESEEKAGTLSKAAEQFQKAIDLKQDYVAAHVQLALTYDQQGKKNDAISIFSKLLQSDPGNQTIQKILDNLRAGRHALQDTPAPSTDK